MQRYVTDTFLRCALRAIGQQSDLTCHRGGCPASPDSLPPSRPSQDDSGCEGKTRYDWTRPVGGGTDTSHGRSLVTVGRCHPFLPPQIAGGSCIGRRSCIMIYQFRQRERGELRVAGRRSGALQRMRAFGQHRASKVRSCVLLFLFRVLVNAILRARD